MQIHWESEATPPSRTTGARVIWSQWPNLDTSYTRTVLPQKLKSICQCPMELDWEGSGSDTQTTSIACSSGSRVELMIFGEFATLNLGLQHWLLTFQLWRLLASFLFYKVYKCIAPFWNCQPARVNCTLPQWIWNKGSSVYCVISIHGCVHIPG